MEFGTLLDRLVKNKAVRKAIDDLVAQHLLIRRHGSGTFVATHLEEQSKYRSIK